MILGYAQKRKEKQNIEDLQNLKNLIAQNENEKAYDLAQRLVLAKPDDAKLRGMLSEIQFRRSQWNEAVFQAREALRLNPELGHHYRVILSAAEQQLGNMLSRPGDEGLLWHIGRQVSRYPDRNSDYEDLPALIKTYLLPDKLPLTKPFSRVSKLLTLGSCFATELRLHLESFNKLADGLWVPEGLNNTYALREFMEWCITGKPSNDAYWYDTNTEGQAVKWTPKEEQENYFKRFEAADGFVITIGLAEVWEDQETGGIFWRGIPKDIYEPGRYVCRMSTVEENQNNIETIVKTLRQLSPTKPIIFTLSPVPLKATFKKTSCVISDCVSKSILRVALHNVISNTDENTYYWPSFEIVKWVGCHLSNSVFGEDAVDQRHVSRFVVPLIMDAFVEEFFEL